MSEWIPNYIRKNLNYRAHEIMTAKEFNAIINLLITQGDYNSSWLNYLQTKGIPDAIAELSIEEIKEAITEAVAEELDALAASVTNKTSAHLNNPVFSFLNLSIQADMSSFRALMEEHHLPGNFCIATNLIGLSPAYPSLLTLQAMELAGHSVLPVGTDGSSLESLTAEEVQEIVLNAKQYMLTNLTDSDVFVYPGGTSAAEVLEGVAGVYMHAVNTQAQEAAVNSDVFNSVREQLPVVMITANASIETPAVKRIIDDAIVNNMFCIIAVDTSANDYSAENLTGVINYLSDKAQVEYATIPAGISACYQTINNRIAELEAELVTERESREQWQESVEEDLEDFKEEFSSEIKDGVLQGCYIDYKDEQGETTEEKYLHW